MFIFFLLFVLFCFILNEALHKSGGKDGLYLCTASLRSLGQTCKVRGTGLFQNDFKGMYYLCYKPFISMTIIMTISMLALHLHYDCIPFPHRFLHVSDLRRKEACRKMKHLSFLCISSSSWNHWRDFT